MQQSSSTSKLSRGKELLRRQISSSNNIHLGKKPLSEYTSNK